jgi:ABC-type uncharacterized transport system ATPase component
LHEGRICFDLEGPDRTGLEVADLIALFAKVRGEAPIEAV